MWSEVLVIDPGAGRVESFGSLSVTGNLLDWYGAVATPDGKIYCIPTCATEVHSLRGLRKVSQDSK